MFRYRFLIKYNNWTVFSNVRAESFEKAEEEFRKRQQRIGRGHVGYSSVVSDEHGEMPSLKAQIEAARDLPDLKPHSTKTAEQLAQFEKEGLEFAKNLLKDAQDARHKEEFLDRVKDKRAAQMAESIATKRMAPESDGTVLPPETFHHGEEAKAIREKRLKRQ